jgi:hypothetical protein
VKTRLLAATALALAALAHASSAAAQACCGGPTAYAPARLAQHEDALLGLQLKATDFYGSFDGKRRFLAAPRGTAEIDLEQDLVAAVRVRPEAQLSLVLPMVETVRKVPGLSEAGGDLGDLQLAARWDFTVAGDHRILPGIALVFGAVLPTGRAPEAAVKPLATDATGTGALQLSPALALEQSFGPALVTLQGSATWRAPHATGALTAQQGVAFSVTATGAYVFKNKTVLSLAATYAAELPAHLDGAAVPGSGRASTRIGVSAGTPIAGRWRVSGTVFSDLPIRGLGASQSAGAGASFVLARAFY